VQLYFSPVFIYSNPLYIYIVITCLDYSHLELFMPWTLPSTDYSCHTSYAVANGATVGPLVR